MQKRFEGSSQDDQNLSTLFIRSSWNITDCSRNLASVSRHHSIQVHHDPICAQSSCARNLCGEQKGKIGGISLEIIVFEAPVFLKGILRFLFGIKTHS